MTAAGAPRQAEAQPAARGGRTVRLAVWGPTSAGKTVLLAKLFLDAPASEWKIFTTEQSQKFAREMRELMQSENRFPQATGGHETVEVRLYHLATGREALLRLEDRPGSDSDALTEPMRSQLRDAEGLVLVLDPMADPYVLETKLWNTLEDVHVMTAAGASLDARPVAVCISKADVLIESAADLRLAIHDPGAFMRRQPALHVLERPLKYLCGNYQFFPVSATGLRLRYGVVEPVVFYDEALATRLGPGGQPFNLMRPFAWLLDQVAPLQ
jgi:hypothetical protein